MKKSLKVIAWMATLAVLMAVQSGAAQGKLEGVWKITGASLTGSNARTIPNPQPGLFIFTKKHYSATVITGEKLPPDLPQKDATDAQKVATWTPFNATAGTYEVKGTTLTLRGIVSKNPGSMAPGNFGIWDCIINGNTLTLTVKADQAGPVANPLTLELMRVE